MRKKRTVDGANLDKCEYVSVISVASLQLDWIVVVGLDVCDPDRSLLSDFLTCRIEMLLKLFSL